MHQLLVYLLILLQIHFKEEELFRFTRRDRIQITSGELQHHQETSLVGLQLIQLLDIKSRI